MHAAIRTSTRRIPRYSILLADDSPDTVETLAEILRDEGHTVHFVLRSSLVLEAVRRYKPQFCVLDIQMPKPNGYELAREIRVAMGEKAPVLIALSGKWTDEAAQFVARAVGFRYFLTKPAHPNDVLAIFNGYGPAEAA
jgi:CheY-like chemotaxis protein